MTDHDMIRHVVLLKSLSMPSLRILFPHLLGFTYPNDEVIFIFPEPACLEGE
jgi:hypothetical protein